MTASETQTTASASGGKFDPLGFVPVFGECDRHGRFQRNYIDDAENTRWFGGDCPKCAVESYASLPLKLRDHRFSAYKNDWEATEQAHRVYRAVKSLSGNLVLLGACGTGKTALAAAAINYVNGSGRPAKYTTILRAIKHIRKGWDADEEQAYKLFFDPILLVIDEIGVQNDTDNEQLILTEIVQRRYDDDRPTWMITNLQADIGDGDDSGMRTFRSVVGERVFDRMGDGDVIVFDGESCRSKAWR